MFPYKQHLLKINFLYDINLLEDDLLMKEDKEKFIKVAEELE